MEQNGMLDELKPNSDSLRCISSNATQPRAINLRNQARLTNVGHMNSHRLPAAQAVFFWACFVCATGRAAH